MKQKQAIRFSLAFLLLLITTAGIWMAAYRHGYRAGDGAWRYNEQYTLAYDVHDLVMPVPQHAILLGPGAPETMLATSDPQPVLTAIKATLPPEDLESTRVVYFPTNLSIIVSGTGRTHRYIREALEQLRTEPPKRQVMVAGDANWIPEGTVVYDQLP